MNNKDKRRKKPIHSDDIDYGFNDVVSGTECTGMMFSPPKSEDEDNSYMDIYNIPTPTVKKKD